MRQFNVQFFFLNADASCYENLFMNESSYKCVFNFLRFKKTGHTEKNGKKESILAGQCTVCLKD